MVEVKHFPADMSVFEVDREDMKKCFLSGLFEEKVKTESGERCFYTYLAPGSLYNSPCLVVAPPAVPDVLAWLDQSFWFSFAEEHKLFLHVLVPGEGGWNEDGSDADYMNKVYSAIQSRRGYVTIQDNIYALGLGGGAVIAQQAVMKMSSEWSGLASCGEMSDKALLNAEILAGAENTGKTELSINAAKVQVPVWMAWEKNENMNAAVCAYWKKQNDACEECFSNEFADQIWFPSTVSKMSQVNEEKISQVRVTNGRHGEPDRVFADALWAFLGKACRHRGLGHKMLRNKIDPEAYGFALKTMEHQGFVRRWYEYVPEAVKKSGRAVPLVVCMHGRGGSAETFLSLSGMSRVAEERNFIALFPESGVYQIRPGALRNLLLWNGEYKGEKFDDVGFILRMIEDVKARYAVDETRVYACGQSSGGMMTSALAERAPEVFAAVSPWSALVDPDHELVLPERMNPAVPFMFLFGDRDWLVADRENGEMEYKVTKPIAAYLRNLISLYGLNGKPSQYVCGEISWYVYKNAAGVPILTVGRVAGMTHANYPRESWIAYDEFMARFSKLKDGTLLYMGEKV
jgi:poly(3-hydroxybutyrate) depolymerase